MLTCSMLVAPGGKVIYRKTGVIDIAGFLQALQEIGYDGPVTPEPFKKELADLPDVGTVQTTVGSAVLTT